MAGICDGGRHATATRPLWLRMLSALGDWIKRRGIRRHANEHERPHITSELGSMGTQTNISALTLRQNCNVMFAEPLSLFIITEFPCLPTGDKHLSVCAGRVYLCTWSAATPRRKGKKRNNGAPTPALPPTR